MNQEIKVHFDKLKILEWDLVDAQIAYANSIKESLSFVDSIAIEKIKEICILSPVEIKIDDFKIIDENIERGFLIVEIPFKGSIQLFDYRTNITFNLKTNGDNFTFKPCNDKSIILKISTIGLFDPEANRFNSILVREEVKNKLDLTIRVINANNSELAEINNKILSSISK